jgi:flagellar biosynthetic protein FlhB
LDQFDEKSFDATPHRREQAAEDGHVARSPDLTSAILLLTSLCLLLWLGSTLAVFCAEQLRDHLGGEVPHHIDAETATNRLVNLAQDLAWRLAPIFGAMMLVAVAVNIAQVGLLFLPEKISPDPSHLDPVSGAGRVFSFASVVRLGFGLMKVVVVVAVAVGCLWSEWPRILGLANLESGQIATYTWEIVIWTGIKIASSLVVLALLDYLYQVWKNDEDLKMSHQEVREEMKLLQGDPHVIQRRKSIMRQMALQNLGK